MTRRRPAPPRRARWRRRLTATLGLSAGALVIAQSPVFSVAEAVPAAAPPTAVTPARAHGAAVAGLAHAGTGQVADPVSAAVTALRTGNLYVDPAAKDRGVTVSGAAVPSAIKIAVLPDSAGVAAAIASEIGTQLGAGRAYHVTIGVFTVTEDKHGDFDASSSTYCPGAADRAAQQATDATVSDLRTLNLAPTINRFVTLLNEAPVDNRNCSAGGGTTSSGSSSGSSSSGLTILLVIVVLAALGVGGYLFYRRRSKRRELSLARVKVQPYVDRLANDINTIDPKGNPKATQAMGDAAERYSAAGSLLATADSVEKVAVARRAVLEGLYASRLAREALGLEPGPDLPPIDETAHPQLAEAQQVQVRGQSFQGYPQYTPGAPYYYGGGYGVPGGWYGVPFWETLLLGSVLSGGFGGGWGWGGGGYDAGYNAGYDAGHDSSTDTGANGGGDFGGGGGDFGGGGGDFGGGFGGDFGGGGGDGGGSW